MTTSAAVVIPDEPVAAENLTGREPLAVPVVEGTIVPHVQRVTLPDRDEWRRLAAQANELAASGTLPKHLNGRPGAVMAVILKGRELGLAPIQSLSAIYFIEGTPTLAAHLMVALVKRAGHEIWYEESSSELAVICGRRLRLDGTWGQVERITWTIEDAERARLTNKDNWKHYPAAMLRARCATALCRMSFPDVLLGTWYAPEELGARVDAQGSIVELPSRRDAEEAARQLEQSNEGEPPKVGSEPVRGQGVYGGADPYSGGLQAPTVDGETAPAEPPAEAEPLDREALWAEFLEQARFVGQSPAAFVNRWVRAHKRSIDLITTPELAAFVAERRPYVAEFLEQNPAAGANEPVGKQPPCPPDPEASADGDAAEGPPAEAEPAPAAADGEPAPDPAPEPGEPAESGSAAPVASPPGEAPGQPEEGSQQTMDAPDTPA